MRRRRRPMTDSGYTRQGVRLDEHGEEIWTEPATGFLLVNTGPGWRAYAGPYDDKLMIRGESRGYLSAHRCSECEDDQAPCPGHDLSALDWARRAFPCAGVRYLGGKDSTLVSCLLSYNDHPHRNHNWEEPRAVTELVRAVLND